MKAYLDLLQHVFEEGETRTDRTGTGTRGVFGAHMEFDLTHSFPLVTTKRVFWAGVVAELLWFLSGSTNVKPLQEQGVHIWDPWADKKTGELGPVYGSQWRQWQSSTKPVDQIDQLMAGLRKDPFSRRHIVSAWNVGELEHMALPPCHLLWQVHIDNQSRVSLQMYQRSADLFLGVPFNIASYGLLLHMIAASLSLSVYIDAPDEQKAFLAKCRPYKLHITLGDAHIYTNHFEQVTKQLGRVPRRRPTVTVTPRFYLDAYTAIDVTLLEYNPHGKISAPISI